MQPRGSPSSENTIANDDNENQVTIIAFYGTSCMGKSELSKFVKDKASQEGANVVDVNKDTVARPMMDAFYQEHPDFLFEDIYMRIFGLVEQKFNHDTFRALGNVKPGKNVVVLDDAWANEGLLKRIAKEDLVPGYKKRIVCVYPKIADKSKYEDLPFSLQFIVNLLYRVVIRKYHETMVYDDIKKIQIVISFLKIYSGIRSIPEKFKAEIPIDEFYPLEFHQESDITIEDERMPPLIREVFKQIEACFQKMGAPFESPLVTGKEEFVKLNDLIQKLIDCQAHHTLNNFINYGRKSEWEKWYQVVFSS